VNVVFAVCARIWVSCTLHFSFYTLCTILVINVYRTEPVVDVFSDSVSSTDGIRTQRPLEQRSNARGASASGRTSTRGDRSTRGKGQPRDTQSNDRTKPSQQQPASASSHMSNDVAVQSATAAKSAAVSAGKEAGDSAKSASDTSQTHNQSKPSSEPSVNNTEASGTDVMSSAGVVAPTAD